MTDSRWRTCISTAPRPTCDASRAARAPCIPSRATSCGRGASSGARTPRSSPSCFSEQGGYLGFCQRVSVTIPPRYTRVLKSMRRNHKVLLIGAKGYQQTGEGVRVDCCLWSALSKLDNIRDYDTVILDLLELQTDGAKKAVDWPDFDQQFNFRNAVDILSNRGTIIVVGDPRFRIPVGSLDRQERGSPEDRKRSINRILAIRADPLRNCVLVRMRGGHGDDRETRVAF